MSDVTALPPVGQPEIALLADDFGCVPDGRFLERVSIGAGSAVLSDHDATLRATDVGKNIAVPGAADLVATITGLADHLQVEKASMAQDSTVLTGRLYVADDPKKATVAFRDAHTGMRITVEKAGPGGATLVSDIARCVDATTVELADPAAVSVDADQDIKVILNRSDRVVLSDYARRTVQDVHVKLGDRSIDDGQMTIGALEVGLRSATARFSSLDLGKTVTIPAAGLLVTSIQSVELPTRVILTAPARRAVQNGQADVWKTDSRPGWERLLSSLAQRDVEAAEIRFGPGVYDFRRRPEAQSTGVVDLRGLRNLTLRGAGAGATVLRLMPDQDFGKLNRLNTHVIESRDCRNLTLRDLSVHGAYLTMRAVNEQMHGIVLNEGSEEIVIERLRVFQTAGDGLRFVGAPTNTVRKIWVDSCRFIQNKRSGVMFQRGAERVWIRNNYIEMTPPSTDACVDFEPSRGSHFPPTDIVIESNIMLHCNPTVAVSLAGIPPSPTTGVEPALRVKFTNNILVGGAVLCTDVDQLTVQNNLVVVSADAGTGDRIIRIPLQIQRGGHALLITGNQLVNEELAHPADAESEAVISLNEVNQRPVTRAMIVGNLCIARSGSGIQLRSSDDVAVEANMVVAAGSCTQGIFVRSQSSSVDNVSIRNNDITVEGPGSWHSGIFLGASSPHEIHHVSVVGNSITATNGVEFVGGGFRQTPVCALNRLGAGVTTPLVGLQLLPQKTMVVGGAASHGGTTPGSGAGRFLAGHGSPEGKVAGNVGDIYQRLEPQPGPRLFVKESEEQPTTGWIAK